MEGTNDCRSGANNPSFYYTTTQTHILLIMILELAFLWTLQLHLLSHCFVNANVDYCQKSYKDGTFTTYENAKGCMDSFDFRDDYRRSTLDTLRKTLQLYVFRDIAKDYTSKDSESPISSHVDLYKELDVLENKPYTKEREFHDDLHALFRSLNDAHTTYTSSCFHKFSFYQPWVLGSRTISGRQGIFIERITSVDTGK